MEPTEAQICERLPVWKALSEFFLDTELQPEDLERISKSLAASVYSADKLEDILVFEVCRGCRINLFAWEWISFDEGWLIERIKPYYNRPPWFKRVFLWRHRWMYERHWQKVKSRISSIRDENGHHC